MKYDYAELDPYIDEETMRTHHKEHHKAYVEKLNELIKDIAKPKLSVIELMKT